MEGKRTSLIEGIEWNIYRIDGFTNKCILHWGLCMPQVCLCVCVCDIVVGCVRLCVHASVRLRQRELFYVFHPTDI